MSGVSCQTADYIQFRRGPDTFGPRAHKSFNNCRFAGFFGQIRRKELAGTTSPAGLVRPLFSSRIAIHLLQEHEIAAAKFGDRTGDRPVAVVWIRVQGFHDTLRG